MKRLAFPIILLLTLASLPALAGERPLRVVATFSILADLVKEVGGDRITVTSLVGAEEDAHTYKPSPGASKILSSADLVFENGLGFEGWISRLVSASGFKGSVIVASEGVTPRQVGGKTTAHNHDKASHRHRSHAHDGNGTDPHAWQSIKNVRIYVRNIADALTSARPEDEKIFKANAEKFDTELQDLDTWARVEVDKLPQNQRKVITSHDAFGYFADAYGINFLSPQGISTDIEPTATQVAKLIEQMKAEKIKTVFFENNANKRLASMLAKDTGAALGAPIYSDALSSPQGPASNYIDLFRHNTTQFLNAMVLNGKPEYP